MRWRIITGWSVVALVITLGGGPSSFGRGPAVVASEAQEGGVPTFEVDASWPSMPNDWVLGQVSSVTVGPDDRIWVLHRPRTVGEDQGTPAPPVLAFEQDGTFVRGWGGPADGFDWPANEHGIHVAPDGNVWIGGNSAQPESDDMLLKFNPEGGLLLQIGGRARSSGNDDTENVMRPAESFVHAATGEVFVADGYGNRRVIVFDAETGGYKRMWGAFANTPLDPSEAGGGPAGPEGPPQFGIVHGIEVSIDGLVYVADRGNSRVQVFDTDGAYRTQGFVNRGAESASTVAGLAFSPDAEQRFMYSADQGNSHIHVIDRATLEVLDTFGSNGAAPGEFQALHHLATDSDGNLYTAEAQRGRRVQKFTFTGMVPPPQGR